MALEDTVQAFGEAFKRLELEGRHSFRHPDFSTGRNNRVRLQIRRVKGILQYLRESSPEKLRELTRSKVKYGGLSSTALTWEFRFQFTEDVPKYAQSLMHGEMFHNEGVIDHLTAYLFGKQGTSALVYLFDDPAWEETNTGYFKGLQKRAREVWDKARTVQQEILESDKIFKVFTSWGHGASYIPDQTWDLSLDETVDLLKEFQRTHTYIPSTYTPYLQNFNMERFVAYHKEGIVLNALHKFRNPERVLRVHNLIDDPKIRQAFPNGDIDRMREVYPPGTPEDHEVAYLVKESERIEEMEALGKEIISIFQSVGKILKGVAEKYKND